MQVPSSPTIDDFLLRTAMFDWNVYFLLAWGLRPEVRGDNLYLHGFQNMDPKDQQGIREWLQSGNIMGVTRRDRIVQALRTGMNCAINAGTPKDFFMEQGTEWNREFLNK